LHILTSYDIILVVLAKENANNESTYFIFGRN
ncbi:MAG: hypothetical protein K0R23_3188, partial [Lacrimispora sp.]|nr:hypothetical protein [Lacrimispora sp.]